jgi:uncharacterized protein YkwD
MKAGRVVGVVTASCAAFSVLLSCQTLEDLVSDLDARAKDFREKTEAKQIRDEQDADNWDIEQLDTARAVSYLSDREKNVVLELNKVRTDPKKYADLYLVPDLKYYQGKEYRFPGRVTLITSEGRSVVEECIRALSSTRPMKVLMPSDLLSLAAKDHVEDTGPKGIVGHTGSDGSSLVSRIQRYDKTRRAIAETIAYGHDKASEIVKSLVIDDGVRSRGHRGIILTPGYDSVGLAIGNHSTYRNICVIDFAQYE